MTVLANLTESAAWRWLAYTPLRRHLAADPSAPVPFNLTPKASDFLARTRHPLEQFGVIGESSDGWACGRCGSAWFGAVPADGQCPDCRDLTAAELAEAQAQAQWEQEADDMWWETVRVMDAAGLLGEPTDAEADQ
jgi:hypothetical protein